MTRSHSLAVSELVGWVSQASGDVHELELIGEQLLLAPRPATTHMVRVLSRVAQNQSGKVGALAGAPVSSLAQGLAVTRGAHALFTGWVVDYGVGVGCAAATTVALIESTGRSVTGVPVGLSPFAEHLPLAEFEAAVASALAQQRDPLLRVKEALDLTDIEVALLFAVSRQAVAQWWTHGVPAARMTAVADIVATVDLLARKLKPGRLPLVARQPAERLGGKTLLHALADDPASTRAVFEEAFDWSAAA